MAQVAVSDLLARCLRDIGVISAGRNPSEYELDDAAMTLNEFLDSMNREGLQFYQRQRTTHVTAAGTAAYFIGTGQVTPNINVARPDQIEGAGVLINTGQQQLERPLGIVRNSVEWQQIPLKNLQSNLIQRFYYDAGILADGSTPAIGVKPSGTVYYYPVPNNVQTVALYTTSRFADITDQSTVIVLPDGYLRFLRTNMAIELAAEYPGAKVSPLLAQQAIDSKAALKSANQRLFVLRCPAELVGGDTGFYDYRSDELRT